SAAVRGNLLELTNGPGQTGSAFSSAGVDITRFTTQFDFRLTNANADGFTFTLQDMGPTALGPGGGGLGYGPAQAGGAGGIGRSVAIKFDLYDNQGEGNNSTGLYVGGAAPTVAGSVSLAGTGIDLHSGDVFRVSMTYDGATLTVTIRNQRTGQAFSRGYAVD